MEKDTLKENSEETIGHMKGVVGDLVGSRHLEAKGTLKQVKGQLHELVGAVKEISKSIKAGVEDGTRQARDGR